MALTAFFKKYLPLLVALDLGGSLWLGWSHPGWVPPRFLVPVLVFVMLYPMMINLRVEEMGRALRNPKVLATALVVNFLVTPLLGALWAHLLFGRGDPYLLIGFILKVCVPGSAMAAAWTGYARGRVESALVIVAWCLLLAIVFIPFWMWLLAGAYVRVDPFLMLQKVVLIVALPLAAGMATRKFLVRRYGQERYRRLAPHFPAVSTLGMLAMICVIIGNQAEMILANLQGMWLVLLGMATLYPLLFALAIAFSRLSHLPHGHCMALGYSVTAKNHAITIALATAAFPGTLAVLPAAVAPMIQTPIMLLFLKLSDRIERFLRAGDTATTAGGKGKE